MKKKNVLTDEVFDVEDNEISIKCSLIKTTVKIVFPSHQEETTLNTFTNRSLFFHVFHEGTEEF